MAIKLDSVVKKYENFKLDEISFTVERGSVVGFIGRNGAGKTSTIKAILDIINLDSGRVEIFGGELLKDDKYKIGAVLEDSFLPEILEVRDLEPIMSNIYGDKWQGQKFASYLNKYEIDPTSSYGKLSTGNKTKLKIILALCHQAKLLILDEPTSGLDPVSRRDILQELMDFMEEEDRTIFFSTHITRDLDKISDHIILIDKGRIVFSSPSHEILENYGLVKLEPLSSQTIDDEDVLAMQKNKYSWDYLVKNRRAYMDRPDCIVEKPTIEDLMIFYLGGKK